MISVMLSEAKHLKLFRLMATLSKGQRSEIHLPQLRDQNDTLEKLNA
jgi:hypothetical protein